MSCAARIASPLTPLPINAPRKQNCAAAKPPAPTPRGAPETETRRIASAIIADAVAALAPDTDPQRLAELVDEQLARLHDAHTCTYREFIAVQGHARNMLADRSGVRYLNAGCPDCYGAGIDAHDETCNTCRGHAAHPTERHAMTSSNPYRLATPCGFCATRDEHTDECKALQTPPVRTVAAAFPASTAAALAVAAARRFWNTDRYGTDPCDTLTEAEWHTTEGA